ncbi:hypothetical protein MIR68_000719 [Amoeboaphelidium protococcarum]|nr:hypothetical protein MIR68_000719 [Amoeboaphelidium protococcarum]
MLRSILNPSLVKGSLYRAYPSAFKIGSTGNASSMINHRRQYAGGRPPKSDFEQRAIELLRGFEKVDQDKLSINAHFSKDLGLDSLDAVEVLIALEDEFMIEIPDEEADQIYNLKQAVDYIYERWSPEHYK